MNKALQEIQIAQEIAVRAHLLQKEESTGDPYILHVQRVVELTEIVEAKPAAWLHDVVEDTVWGDYHHFLLRGISRQTVIAVVLLTKLEEQESYAEYIQQIKESGNEFAIAVKIADLKDHLRPNCPERLRERYIAAWRVLCPGIELPCTYHRTETDELRNSERISKV